jgi:hypothetical protein
VREPASRIKFALFPTPPIDYFVRCVNEANPKPHLAHIAREVLNIRPEALRVQRRGGGWLFTRFMLAGFAAHRALEQLGVNTLEAYPYLAFALWKKADESLPPKSAGRAALKARAAILARLASKGGIWPPIPRSLDQADAAALAITAQFPAVAAMFKSPAHGRFLLALDIPDALAVKDASQ